MLVATNRRTPVRSRRWLRRVGLALLAIVLALTLAATAFDLATAGDERPATALYPGPFAHVDGTLVAYRSWGTAGTPIVLLGGAAEPSWVWHAVGPLLAAAHHRVFAIDLPPFGYTQRKGPYTMTRWLGLLRGFEQRLHISRPVLVGHSLGAGVAAADALASPAGVAGIVLLDGDALPFGTGRAWIADLLVYPFYPALFQLATGSDWLVARILRNAWGRHAPSFGHAVVQQFERPFRVRGTAEAIKQFAARGIPGVTLESLRSLRVPRSVVWGADDTVDSVGSGHVTASALHVPLQIIAGAGHLSMLAKPNATAAAILRLVRDSRRR